MYDAEDQRLAPCRVFSNSERPQGQEFAARFAPACWFELEVATMMLWKLLGRRTSLFRQSGQHLAVAAPNSWELPELMSRWYRLRTSAARHVDSQRSGWQRSGWQRFETQRPVVYAS